MLYSIFHKTSRTASSTTIIVRVEHLNKNTFEKFYEKYFFLDVHKFQAKGYSLEDAKEHAQDVFLTIYEKRDQLKSEVEANFRAWLNIIVQNKWKNLIRSSQTIKRNAEVIPLHDREGSDVGQDDTPEWHFLQKATQDQIVQALKLLPEHLREVLILRAFREHSYEEIAILLKIPKSTVRNRLFQARHKLHQRLEALALTGRSE